MKKLLKVPRGDLQWEIKTIERYETWIGVKWVFKNKLNENDKVDKYKARLMTKGYVKQHGSYIEVFAPIARWDTIQMVIALAARNSWSLCHLDVKSVFLYRELNEGVFVEQPQGYEKKNEE